MRAVVSLAVVLVACSSDPPPPPPAPTVIVQAAAPAAAPAGADATDPRAEAIRARYAKFEYRIPMRDGTRLFTSVFVPNDASAKKRYPILLARTPYGVDPYGADRYPRVLASEQTEQDGYIFVQQDVRGRYMSEGEFVDVRPHGGAISEANDTYDTIEWLLANVPHHNGKVGMWGQSYNGFYTSMGAISRHPALVAICPQAPVTDWWNGDDFRRNGIFALQMGFTFYSVFGKPRPAPTDDEEWKQHEFGTPDAYQYFLDLGPLSEIDEADFGGPVPFWDEVMAHPDYDEWWQARSVPQHLENLRVASLVVGGWYDTEDLYGALATYQGIAKQNPRLETTLLMGPWSHGMWHTDARGLGDDEFGFVTSQRYRDLFAAFFAHHLKGGPDPGLPGAVVYETGADRWRTFRSWPPPGTVAQPLHLAGGGALAAEAPAGEGFDEYLADPNKPVPYTAMPTTGYWKPGFMAEDQRFASTRPDVLVYATAPLERDLTVAGPIEVELQVSSTATDADFIVKLVDAMPPEPRGWSDDDAKAGKRNRGAQQTLVRAEGFRTRYRNGTRTPEPLVPGEVVTLRFTLDDAFHTFQRGHRVMVHVQSSWFPFYERNPQTFVANTAEATRAHFVKATHRVHHGSKVTLPVLPAPDR